MDQVNRSYETSHLRAHLLTEVVKLVDLGALESCSSVKMTRSWKWLSWAQNCTDRSISRAYHGPNGPI